MSTALPHGPAERLSSRPPRPRVEYLEIASESVADEVDVQNVYDAVALLLLSYRRRGGVERAAS